MTNSMDISREWLTDLSERNNLININMPYVPLLLKDFRAYVESSDYECNRIKTIQTIGFIQRKDNIIKIVDSNRKGAELLICINELSVTDVYFDVPRNSCNSIWEYNAVRVYGTLEKEGGQVILNVTQIFEINNVVLCEKMFDTLYLLVRTGYHQYFTTEAVEKLLDT